MSRTSFRPDLPSSRPEQSTNSPRLSMRSPHNPKQPTFATDPQQVPTEPLPQGFVDLATDASGEILPDFPNGTQGELSTAPHKSNGKRKKRRTQEAGEGAQTTESGDFQQKATMPLRSSQTADTFDFAEMNRHLDDLRHTQPSRATADFFGSAPDPRLVKPDERQFRGLRQSSGGQPNSLGGPWSDSKVTLRPGMQGPREVEEFYDPYATPAEGPRPPRSTVSIRFTERHDDMTDPRVIPQKPSMFATEQRRPRQRPHERQEQWRGSEVTLRPGMEHNVEEQHTSAEEDEELIPRKSGKPKQGQVKKKRDTQQSSLKKTRFQNPPDDTEEEFEYDQHSEKPSRTRVSRDYGRQSSGNIETSLVRHSGCRDHSQALIPRQRQTSSAVTRVPPTSNAMTTYDRARGSVSAKRQLLVYDPTQEAYHALSAARGMKDQRQLFVPADDDDPSRGYVTMANKTSAWVPLTRMTEDSRGGFTESDLTLTDPSGKRGIMHFPNAKNPHAGAWWAKK